MEPPTYSTRSKRKSNELEASSPPSKKSRTSLDPDLPPSSPLSSPSSTSADAVLTQSPMDPENLDIDHADPGIPSRGGFRGRGRGRGRSRGGGRMARNGNAVLRSASDLNAMVAGGKPSRGRGGHRVKKSSNARIQSLYHRKQLLKTQYKQVALLQRAALDAIAEKSLQEMSDNPKYHETLPEFQVLMEKLAKKHAARVALLEAQRAVQLQGVERQRLLAEEYTRGVYEVCCFVVVI